MRPKGFMRPPQETVDADIQRLRASLVEGLQQLAKLKRIAPRLVEAERRREPFDMTALGAAEEDLDPESQSILEDFDAAAGLNKGDDDDLGIVGMQVSIICPLSQVTFVNPVKSTVCGHSFSEAAVRQLLSRPPAKGKKPVQGHVCPVAGCGKPLTMGDLVPNKKMQALVEKELQKKSAISRRVDEDMEVLDDSD